MRARSLLVGVGALVALSMTACPALLSDDFRIVSDGGDSESSSGGSSGSSSGNSSGSSGGSSSASSGGNSSGSGSSGSTTSSSGSSSGNEDGGEDGGTVSPTDLTWAQWPMPNSPVDVAAGAPNPESYTTGTGASAGTVTDNVTGLMWQQTPTDDGGTFPTFTWTDAATYCTGLNLAGHQDWRLPALIELVSIVDYGVSNPSMNATYFPSTPANSFWSSTPVAGSPGSAWDVDFSNLGGGGSYNNDGSTADNVRCVRGGVGPFAPSPGSAPPGRYTTTGAGAATTVYDTKTKLTWQQTPTEEDGGTFPLFTWGSASTSGTAQNYCATLSLNGTGWRLPTVGELQSLIDYSQTGASAAMIDSAYFPSTPGSDFWSATPAAGSPGGAWRVFFNDSLDCSTGEDSEVGNSSYVRCVR